MTELILREKKMGIIITDLPVISILEHNAIFSAYIMDKT